MAPDAMPPMGSVRVWYPLVTSTMDVAMALAIAGAPHGTLVEAAEQSAGRGRQDRRWLAPAGSAFLGSWLMRTPAGVDLAGLSPAVAAAMMRAVETLAPGAPIEFKWPNDVLVDGRKVAGILLISRATPAGVVVIAGTGINVHRESVPPGVAATCLAAWADVAVAAVRDRLAAELDSMWTAYCAASGIPEADLRMLERHMAHRGERVEVVLAGGSIAGIATGLAPDGGLRLRALDGSAEQILHVGEVVRGPRQDAGAGPQSAVYLPKHDRR